MRQNTQHVIEVPERDDSSSQRLRPMGIHRIWEPIITEQVERRKKNLDSSFENNCRWAIPEEFSRRGTATAEILVLWSSNQEIVLDASIDSIPPFATIAHWSSLAQNFSRLDIAPVIRTRSDCSRVMRMEFDNKGGAQGVQSCPVTSVPTPNDNLGVDSESTIRKAPEDTPCPPTPSDSLGIDSESKVSKPPQKTPWHTRLCNLLAGRGKKKK
ncbi:hypothetical protein H0H93_009604 [Arthromyces matolae]|nr:hypothetical protein H0H93_009604 [Arthromyces matolae]